MYSYLDIWRYFIFLVFFIYSKTRSCNHLAEYNNRYCQNRKLKENHDYNSISHRLGGSLDTLNENKLVLTLDRIFPLGLSQCRNKFLTNLDGRTFHIDLVIWNLKSMQNYLVNSLFLLQLY